MAFGGAGQSATSRVALVMGNGAYKSAGQLPNAARDAEAMAAALKSIGFEVVLGTDLDRDGMMQRLNDFGSRANSAEVALFFYAGHGIQLDGKNLLIPVDADLRTEFDAKMRTVEIDAALQSTIADAKVKLIFLDACRDTPFAKQIQAGAPKSRSVTVSTGLAEMRPGTGTLIAFATGPGQVALDGEGVHSPFTRALLDNIEKTNVEIRHMLTFVRQQVVTETKDRQLPWENTNLTGFFYLNELEAAALAEGAAVPPPGVQLAALSGNAEMERELWTSVKGSTDPAEYRAYLEKFPSGTFADLARMRIASLSKPGSAVDSASTASGPDARTAEASKATEQALGFDDADWKDIQTRLVRLGFKAGKATDKVSDQTRFGLKEWQSNRNYPVGGYLNKPQYDALLREALPETPPVAATSAKDKGKSTQATRSVQPTSSNRQISTATTTKKQQKPAGGMDPGAAAFVGGLIGGALGGALGR